MRGLVVSCMQQFLFRTQIGHPAEKCPNYFFLLPRAVLEVRLLVGPRPTNVIIVTVVTIVTAVTVVRVVRVVRVVT